MKTKISKLEAKEKIENFFEQDKIEAKYVKKIKRLAMKFHIRLGNYKRRFCKKCLSDLRDGNIRINKSWKNVKCKKCNYVNKWKIN